MKGDSIIMDSQNFQLWYSRILKPLYFDPHAGFPILMITFPLLERYLREKSQNYENHSLDDRFHSKLLDIFPELITIQNSKKFWMIYRHGILHQATLKEEDKTISGCLTGKYETIFVENNRVIYINPAGFSKKVIKTIQSDFEIFIASSSTNHMLPIVYELPSGGNGTAGHGHNRGPNGLIGQSETVSGGQFRFFNR